jgi:hypothetical protein
MNPTMASIIRSELRRGPRDTHQLADVVGYPWSKMDPLLASMWHYGTIVRVKEGRKGRQGSPSVWALAKVEDV